MMKPISYYNNSGAYPHKKDFTTVYAYSKGAVIWQGPATLWAEVEHTVDAGTIEKVLDRDAYDEALHNHNATRARLAAEFKADLLENYNVTNNPKALLAFEVATSLAANYDNGGFEAVAGCFDEIIDLIKD